METLKLIASLLATLAASWAAYKGHAVHAMLVDLRDNDEDRTPVSRPPGARPIPGAGRTAPWRPRWFRWFR